ncbi:hypothetical protein ANN_14496 [Periplaneta americana]|uniref:Uncharacterized protein n=1 Tax=Periplaneta americana TaxID=6978 RepID=A0ABQ8SWH4_PERAM|nr:hypothetical protein ANN_14496 [Periplaneta americana]
MQPQTDAICTEASALHHAAQFRMNTIEMIMNLNEMKSGGEIMEINRRTLVHNKYHSTIAGILTGSLKSNEFQRYGSSSQAIVKFAVGNVPERVQEIRHTTETKFLHNSEKPLFTDTRENVYNGPKKPIPHMRKNPNQRKKKLKKPRDNEHLADVLETYDNK